MMEPEADLKNLERLTFRAAVDSGLWDVFLASFFAMFAIAPLLSGRLGDFWSSAVFLPVWAAVYAVIRLIQARVVRPRIGSVRFSAPRRRRLATLTLAMFALNVIALVLGIVAAARAPSGGSWAFPFVFSGTLLVGFTLAGWLLQIPRLFAYGLMLAAAPAVGEVLWRRGLASHHGFPVVFGLCAAVIFVIGIVRFIRFLPPRRDSEGSPVTGSTHG